MWREGKIMKKKSKLKISGKNKNTSLELFKNIILIFLIIILNVLTVVRKDYFKIEYNTAEFIIKSILLIIICVINNSRLNVNKILKKIINVFIIIVCSLSCVFNSVNSFGLIILFLFLNILTVVVMTKSKYNYEICLVISVSLLILFFIFLALLGLLKFSKIFMLGIAVMSLIYLMKKKEEAVEQVNNIDKAGAIIFTILFLIAILSGIGRYVSKWDEYSYWAYAAKVLINTNSLRIMISRVSSMYGYPPVSSIWHYITCTFVGYSEPNLYIGLSILTYVYMMPIFMYCKKKNILFNILLVMSTISFPILFDGSITYGLLYVDLLLGIMCVSALVLKDYIDENKIVKIPLYLILLLIILLKPNGFVFSCSIIFLFWLKDLMKLTKINCKSFINSIKKYVLAVVIVLLVYGLWYIYAKYVSDSAYGYMFNLLPDSLKSDILPKLNKEFILRFLNGIVNTFDETILYSFINIPLFAFLVSMLAIIVYLNHNKEQSKMKIIIPYFAFYTVFLFLTAVSLFVMFSYYEASVLASFTRYLSPINIAISLFILYKFSKDKSKEKAAYIFYTVIIILIGFSNLTFFATDIKNRISSIDTKNQREQIFSVINKNTSSNSRVYVLNQTDEESGIMPMWYARFYCYPRVINASSSAISWKIKTKLNESDLQDWGLNNKKLVDHLIEYKFDYLFLYTKDDELFNELSTYFDDVSVAKEYSLFKIKKYNNTLKLIPVR